MRVAWSPQPGSQVSLLSCPIFEVLFIGPRGTGKTDCLIMDYAKDVGRGFGEQWRGVLFRQSYKQLGDVIAKTRQWFSQFWTKKECWYNSSEHYWAWATGERLFLRHFERDDDYYDYHGFSFNWVGWEELCNWHTLVGYKRMFSTIRSTHPEVAKIARIRGTANPHGPGHNQVKARFRISGRGLNCGVIKDSRDKDGRLEPMRCAIPTFLHENKILLAAESDYLGKVSAAASSESERKAWIEGDWDIVSGGMFDDVWNSTYNITQPFPIPREWPIYRSMDWGSSHPFSVGWWTVSPGNDIQLDNGRFKSTVRGDLYRIGEWYGSTGEPDVGLRLLPAEVGRGIVERELEMGIYGRVQPGAADSQMFYSETGLSIADTMAAKVRLDNGQVHRGPSFVMAEKGPHSRKPGWLLVRKVIKAASPIIINDRKMPREYSGLFIFADKCPDFERTFPTAIRKEKDLDDLDTKTEDHICLAAMSQIRTRAGTFPIHALTDIAGEIWTDLGWQFYFNCRKTKRDAARVRVVFDDGGMLECTPDHRLCTRYGLLVRADETVGLPIRRVAHPGDVSNPIVVSVIPIESGDVYCLTVPSIGRFAVNNGYIVSNCDETRYFVKSQENMLRYSRTKGLT